MKKIIILLVCFSFIKCEENNIKDETTLIFFEKNSLQDLQKKVECIFIPLETINENLMGYIEKVIVANNKIYILDTVNERILHVFTLDGKYLSQVGNIGNGPEEYVGALNFHIIESNNSIIIEDRFQNILYFYDLTTHEYKGKKNIPFNFNEFLYFDDNLYIWYSSLGFEKDNKNYSILMTDSMIENRSYYLQTDLTTAYLFGSGDTFITHNDSFYHYSYLCPLLFKIDINKVTPYYSIGISNIEFPPKDYLQTEIHKKQKFINNLMSSDYISTYSLFNTNNHLYIYYYFQKINHIGIYNKNNEKSYIYDYNSFLDETLLTGLSSVFVGTYNDYLICYLSPYKLKNKIIKRDDLKAIADEISEDDNPVLCFLKINDE